MLSRIVSVRPGEPGGYAPLLPPGVTEGFFAAPLLLGYELGGAPCGVLAADCFEHAITLRWLGVDASVRRRGIAGELLDALCALADETGVRELDAVVSGDGEGPVRSLLFDRGFACEDVSPVYRFPLSAVLNGPLSAALDRKEPRVTALNSLPAYLLRDLNAALAAPDGPMYPAIDPGALLEESMAWLENGEVTACLLLAPCGEGIELRWIYSRYQSRIAVQSLFAGAARALGAHYPPQTVVHAAALIPSADTILHRLTGGQLTREDSVARYCRRREP